MDEMTVDFCSFHRGPVTIARELVTMPRERLKVMHSFVLHRMPLCYIHAWPWTSDMRSRFGNNSHRSRSMVLVWSNYVRRFHA